jgi:hypothetical protein
VTAVVLTYQARSSLERCLDALAQQDRPLDATIVVDNAGDEPLDGLVTSRGAQLLRLPQNGGPAGGYAAGLRAFLLSGADYAWVMDDDCRPSPDALAAQLAAAWAGADVVLGKMVDPSGESIPDTQGWCGVLIARDVVERVGVPNEALFWWTEDTEYLQWRIPRAGFTVRRCDAARIAVTRARASASKPAWKYYYEARNQVFHRLHTQRVPRSERVHRSLTLRIRSWRAASATTKLATRALVRERDDRLRKALLVARGAADGVRGRLGQVVAVDSADRPVDAATEFWRGDDASGCGVDRDAAEE